MRKALSAADHSIMGDIDALKDIVSVTVKSSVGHLSDSLRSCEAAITFADASLIQLRQSPDDAEGRFLHHAQQFLEAAQRQASSAKAAVAHAIESTKTMMDFLGVDMKPAKVRVLWIPVFLLWMIRFCYLMAVPILIMYPILFAVN